MGMAGLAIVAYILSGRHPGPGDHLKWAGLNTIAVHLLYSSTYAMLSAITPPVGAAAFLAAPSPGPTDENLDLPHAPGAFVIYLYRVLPVSPALLLQGTWTRLVLRVPSIIAHHGYHLAGLRANLLGLQACVQNCKRFADGRSPASPSSFPGLMTT